MAKTLYVYLKGGRGDAKVTEIWDGAEPTEEGMVDTSGVIVGTDGKEVSEPYRDDFPSTTRGYSGANSGAGLTATFDSTVAVNNAYLAEGAVAMGGGVGSIISKLSDAVAHVKPRQYYKVYTWLVFEDDDGTPYKFRKADIVGWGSYPRR